MNQKEIEELVKLHNKSAEEINKKIDEINNCEKHDNWCEQEKRGCKGCFHNKKRIIEILMTEKEDGGFDIEVNKIIDNEISNDIMKMFTKIFL